MVEKFAANNLETHTKTFCSFSRQYSLNSEGWMPAGVCPKVPADLRVADQKADRLGDFGRLDQSASRV
jgi:hypothetical protein